MALPRRSIPSISGLIAFEATARHLSFSQAATDLSLTQGAVSKRVNRLEQVLGVQLIARDTHRISLTTVGENYLRHVQWLLTTMERSILDVVNQAAGVVTVAVSAPDLFAVRWLIPHLSDFNGLHPGIQINVCADDAGGSCMEPHLDGRVSLGQRPLPGASAVALFAEDLLAVATPEFLRGHEIRCSADLDPSHMLHLSTRMHLWANWLNAQGITGEKILSGPVYTNSPMVLSAAKCGQGAALLPRFALAEALATGALMVVGHAAPMSEKTYWFNTSAIRRLSPSAQLFASWMARQGAGSTPIRQPAQADQTDETDLQTASTTGDKTFALP